MTACTHLVSGREELFVGPAHTHAGRKEQNSHGCDRILKVSLLRSGE
jgi:hypothetical protein